MYRGLRWAFAGLLVTTSACAQQQPFVPYTINAEQHKLLTDYLGEVPAKYANPLLNTLAQWEAAAQKAAAEQTKPKEPSDGH